MDLTIYNFSITRKEREYLKNQKACTIWMSGLSGSGKSTIANALEIRLNSIGNHTFILDGDNTRSGLNKDLGFSDEDRSENLRRAAQVCKILNDAGIIVISSFISPFEKDRKIAKEIIGDDFIEIYIDTPIETCETRDPKGLYEKARNGEIKNFTGISSEFEEPSNAIFLPNESVDDIEENVAFLIQLLTEKKYIR